MHFESIFRKTACGDSTTKKRNRPTLTLSPICLNLPEMNQFAVTVNGKVPIESLGVVLPHEHVIHRVSIHSNNPDNTCVDVNLMTDECRMYKDAGGGTICDLTPAGLGRDPAALKEVSRKAGVHIVSSVGLYQAEVFPSEIKNGTEETIARYIMKEIAGEETGIQAGLIGEIASHNEPEHSEWRRYRLNATEEKTFAAVAAVQKKSGLSVSTHACLGRSGVSQIKALKEGGADPERIVIGHCDTHIHEDPERDFDYYHALLNEGVFLEFDLFSWEDMAPDRLRFKRIAQLAEQGYVDRILISTDTCRNSHLHKFGGRGLDYLFSVILPNLEREGVTKDHLTRITCRNPARILQVSSG